jgi:hypothetical protein
MGEQGKFQRMRQEIHAAENLAAAPLSRKDREALSYLVKAPFSHCDRATVFRPFVTRVTRLQHRFVVYAEA